MDATFFCSHSYTVVFFCVCERQDEKRLLASTKTSMYMWDCVTGEKIDEMSISRVKPFKTGCTFTNEGSSVICHSEQDIQIWKWNKFSVRHRQELKLRWHKDMIMKIAISPDDSMLASCGFDGIVVLWDLLDLPNIEEKKLLDFPILPAKPETEEELTAAANGVPAEKPPLLKDPKKMSKKEAEMHRKVPLKFLTRVCSVDAHHCQRYMAIIIFISLLSFLEFCRRKQGTTFWPLLK